ncbi:hypothetical protein [Allomeiothermus silvanus]|uniref:hypothetical protein n=1 Tax=Allomeiothermus silvanus TaxID=52022 RepID=UPI0023F0B800|nr:hypothetical protein [Allomeiothermus silvanus]
MADLLASLPEAISPQYVMSEPNAAICLYRGPVRVRIGANTWRAAGALTYTWFPSSGLILRIREVPGSASGAQFPLEADFEISGGRPFRGSLLSIGSRTELTFLLSTVEKTYVSGPLTKLLFHIPNFVRYGGNFVRKANSYYGGRIEATYDCWKVTIDQIKDANLNNKLHLPGSFDITHVGLLERSDGMQFYFDDVQDVLRCLGITFTFIRGGWCVPFLLVGQDNDGNKMHAIWETVRIDPIFGGRSWFPRTATIEAFSELLPLVADKMRREKDGQDLQALVDWYAFLLKNTGEPYFALPIVTSALDLIFWDIFVGGGIIKDENSIDKLNVADRIRLILDKLKVSSDIPPACEELKKAAESKNWADLPHALTELRNSLVHPKKRERLYQVTPRAVWDVVRVGIQYLELGILRMLGYKGSYWDRISDKEAAVPWA